MKKQKLFFLSSSLLLVILFFGCSVSRLSLDRDKLGDHLGIKITFSESVDTLSIGTFNKKFDEFITEYNAEHRLFDVFKTNDQRKKTLSIEINNIEYVSGGKQTFSVLVSLLGAATFVYTLTNPDLGFWVYWYWFPRYEFTSTLYLSNDISVESKSISKTVNKFHGFNSIESQRETLGDLFKEFLYETIEELEKND